MEEIRGRFAPTPSGPLHFGSLVAALGSYLHSKSRGGQWFVRIDDLDTERTISGIDSEILKTLETFGLHWDGEVLYQSSKIAAYHEAIVQLSDKDLIYPCACSRKEIGDQPYPGTCRKGLSNDKNNLSIRLLTNNKPVEFHDLKQGLFKQNIEAEIGDFVIKRADGYIAYHLATMVDDEWQKITEVVRGADLLNSTPRQIYIQKLLGFSQTEFLHLPIATDEKGQKLGKSNGALKIEENPFPPSQLIYKALNFLGQSPPEKLQHETVDNCIQWGLDHWSINSVPEE